MRGVVSVLPLSELLLLLLSLVPFPLLASLSFVRAATASEVSSSSLSPWCWSC
ncbi:hypothetical protein BVRB_008040 [Beta vulgaris subsp. vulgaris]|uniref:Uncharacterized protein n=1 Tax=Beta vulgaris subsp. vulgaris TaxID=3555 RepID=A0A0J8B6N7_BETVV|nr:hypothetical protein BVRB_008040 [Beta vulgaris subsp. vulgaris]